MDDRELLELAAKAVGYEGRYIFRAGGSKGSGWPYDIVGFERVGGAMWNPLTNDGDALRLAIALPSCIVIDGEMKWCGVHMPGERGKYDFSEGFEGDPAAATRRAIVRAAAAIGEALKNNP